MNILYKRAVVLLLLSIVSLYLVALFTTSPEVTSGNGNLGLLFDLPAVIIFVLFANCLWKILGGLKWKQRIWKIVSLGSLLILLLCCLLQYQFTLNLIDQLGGSRGQETSRIYRYSWLNQYTNTLFINIYTFLILNSGVVFIYTIFKRKHIES